MEFEFIQIYDIILTVNRIYRIILYNQKLSTNDEKKILKLSSKKCFSLDLNLQIFCQQIVDIVY